MFNKGKTSPITTTWLIAILIASLLPPIATAEELLLAKLYREDIDLSQYYVSEKLDGVRAYWDGETLRSRNGNVFAAPGWFVEKFPAAALDGELWSGRGNFEEISGIVRRAEAHQGWKDIVYMVFDMPQAAGDFSSRLRAMQDAALIADTPYLRVVEQREIADKETLMRHLQELVDAGAEGLMLRRKASFYRGGRSDDLLKLKLFEDAEAVVVSHNPGKGKFTGMMGSVNVRMPSGKTFRIGSGFTEAERVSPPPVGATVTYKFSGMTNSGLPRFPVFLRVRDDEPAAELTRQ